MFKLKEMICDKATANIKKSQEKDQFYYNKKYLDTKICNISTWKYYKVLQFNEYILLIVMKCNLIIYFDSLGVNYGYPWPCVDEEQP